MPVQTNLKAGSIRRKANEDLTGMELRLCKLVNDATQPRGAVALPTALADLTPYLVEDGAAIGLDASIAPLHSNQEFRVVAKGAGNAGAQLVMADPVVPADKGKVRVLPATTGTYVVVGFAEETFVDGQQVLMRPAGARAVVVP